MIGTGESSCGQDPCSGVAVGSGQPASVERSTFPAYLAQHIHPHLGGSPVRLAYLVPRECLQYGDRYTSAGGEHADVALGVFTPEQGAGNTDHEDQLCALALQGTRGRDPAGALEYVCVCAFLRCVSMLTMCLVRTRLVNNPS